MSPLIQLRGVSEIIYLSNRWGLLSAFPQKINKAVSFNAIKNMACELFFNQNQQDQQVINEKLTELFMTGTIVQRKDRSPPRDKISPRRSLNYQKRNRKHVF